MRLLSGLGLLTLFLLAATAAASPAMIARGDAGASTANTSFASFAEDWMGRAQARGTRDSKAPRAHPGAAGLIFTYRAVDEQFETELRETGRPTSPYVGVLYYTEHTFTCQDVMGGGCRVTSSLPVTEVFRYRDGRWSY